VYVDSCPTNRLSFMERAVCQTRSPAVSASAQSAQYGYWVRAWLAVRGGLFCCDRALMFRSRHPDPETMAGVVSSRKPPRFLFSSVGSGQDGARGACLCLLPPFGYSPIPHMLVARCLLVSKRYSCHESILADSELQGQCQVSLSAVQMVWP